jgi:hypothetical protein
LETAAIIVEALVLMAAGAAGFLSRWDITTALLVLAIYARSCRA